LEAVTITPMRAALLMGAEQKTNRLETYLEGLFHRAGKTYQNILGVALNHAKLVVVLSLAIFAASLFLIRGIKQEFVPRQDQNIILLSGQTPTGTSLEATYQKALELEEVIKKHPLVQRYFVSIGAGWGAGGCR
jgi:multidrug efflux pump subunit AcrB